jgi:hypothetical protein
VGLAARSGHFIHREEPQVPYENGGGWASEQICGLAEEIDNLPTAGNRIMIHCLSSLLWDYIYFEFQTNMWRGSQLVGRTQAWLGLDNTIPRRRTVLCTGKMVKNLSFCFAR